MNEKNKTLLKQARSAVRLKGHDEEEVFERYSLPFDFFLWLNSSAMDELVEGICNPYLKLRTGSKIRDDYKAKLVTSVKLIILNLMQVEKHRVAEALAIPRDNMAIQPIKKYGPNFISVDAFNEAYEKILNGSYLVELAKGRQQRGDRRGHRTRVVANMRLKELLDKIFPQEIVFFQRHPEEEVIELRKSKYEDKIVRLKAYSDTDDIVRQRENLRQINKVLNSHWYDLELSDAQFEELRVEMRRRSTEDSNKHFFLDITARRLKRIYSNNSFEKGGRFFGGWWQGVPKKYRKYLRIGGKLTEEYDFSNMHPTILYAQEGVELAGDAYTIDGFDRENIKKAWSTLLNKESLRKPKKFDAEKYGGCTWEELRDAILEKHKPIAHLFGSGSGLALQKVEAQIAEIVLVYFARKNQACLPIHDSFIVKGSFKDELEQIMISSFEEVVGVKGIAESKQRIGTWTTEYIQGLDKEGSREIRSESMEQYNKKYEGYLRRARLAGMAGYDVMVGGL